MSQSYEVTGKVHQIGETQTFDSGFCKRICVVEFTDGDYTNHLAVDFLKDKCSLLDSVAIGQEVTIHYNLRSNENRNKQGQWFTNAAAWRIDAQESGRHQMDGHPMPQQQPAQSQTATQVAQPAAQKTDDIPFN